LGTSLHGTLSVDMRQSQASRTHAVVDLSALVPQSGNLFVRLRKQIRSPCSRSRFIAPRRGLSHVLM
jgi:hypothetical protein